MAVNQDHGLVVTNWHVVRDATGQIVVAFPDGFRSGATVLRMDRDWDLAALAIWRPNVQPIPLSSEPPKPGDPLTIAGYGSGSYREATGRCTQYVSPGGNNPYEMVELSAGARFGDSGGPILNQRGELAGVLFGSSFGKTAGSYCGRVGWFLTFVADDFRRLQPNPVLLARQPPLPNQTRPAAAAPETRPAAGGEIRTAALISPAVNGTAAGPANRGAQSVPTTPPRQIASQPPLQTGPPNAGDGAAYVTACRGNRFPSAWRDEQQRRLHHVRANPQRPCCGGCFRGTPAHPTAS